MFSNRLPSNTEQNALSRALDALVNRGADINNLTESNPTRAELAHPGLDLAALSGAAAHAYDPQPSGMLSAREAIALDQQRRGANVDPADIVLTASTSEGYSWLFKLFCSPGHAVLVPRPSYPLFDHLTSLEAVRADTYPLHYDGRWSIDLHTVRQAASDVRALLVVSPNNPTGSFVTEHELSALCNICRERGWPLIVDEVFADYTLETVDPITDIASRNRVLSFTLAGLSKSVGLPQMKLAWIVAGGPDRDRRTALSGLELIADNYLSVGTPVQVALPELLRQGASIRKAVQERIRNNLSTLRKLAAQYPACDVLKVEGGWSAVIRVPSTRSEERLALDLLEREHVLVHPGFFFDFSHESFVVVSLLPPRARFDDGIVRLLRLASSS
jgi:aspartate/methionine/tyrosine aminotransferase